jgi:hypothetical protein
MPDRLPALGPSPGPTSLKAAATGRALHDMRHGYLLGHERRRQDRSARTRTSDGGFGRLSPAVSGTLAEQRLSIVRWRVTHGRLSGDQHNLPFACHRQPEPTLERQLQALRLFLETTYTHMSALDRSYMLEHKGTAKPEDRAALLTAVGWLNGWRPLLALIQPAR